MNKLLLILVACFALAGTASAQFTPADKGHFFDPLQSGQSFELRVLPNRDVFAYIQLGVVPGFSQTATWYSVQGPQVPVASDGVKIDLYSVQGVLFGSFGTPTLVPYGDVVLYRSAAGIDAVVTIDGRGDLFFGPRPATIVHGLKLVKLLD